MADYKVADTELTSIANAIRTKGGTQAQLEFPTGFVSAVQAIPAGGNMQEKTIITNGSITPDSGFDGFSRVIVAVPNEQQIVVPSGYSVCSAIESDSVENYIDTGIILTEDLWYLIGATFDSNIVQSQFVIGSRNARNNAEMCFYMFRSGSMSRPEFRFGDKEYTTLFSVSASSLEQVNYISFQGTSRDMAYNQQQATMPRFVMNSTQNTIYLFNLNNNGTPLTNGQVGRIYFCRIGNSAGCFANFVPCVRTLDNKPGFYDTVRGQFYSNSGIGNLIAVA